MRFVIDTCIFTLQVKLYLTTNIDEGHLDIRVSFCVWKYLKKTMYISITMSKCRKLIYILPRY